jgi:hypothetical protein
MEGSGRNSEIIGSKTAQAFLDVPNKIPNGTDTATASKNPIITRRVDARMSAINTPFSKVLTPRLNTSDGAGKKIGSTHPDRHAVSQTARKTMTDTQLMKSKLFFCVVLELIKHPPLKVVEKRGLAAALHRADND